MAEQVNLQQKIQQYRQSNPKLKNLSDKQILSIMVQNGQITLTETQKRSIFGNNETRNSNMGLQVEKSAPKSNPEKTIYLQSGRKVVYSKTANGKVVMKYYGTDGTQLKPDYFKKVEGEISISADGTSYTLVKNGKKSKPIKAKDPTKGAIDQNLAHLNNEEKRLNKTKKEQGFIGSGWDWIKNKTGLGDSSDKAQKQIEAERNLLNQIKTGKVSKSYFKEVTGLDYSKENLEKFKRGELSQATAKIDGYKEGQNMAVDVAGDLVSGIAAVGIYTAAVVAAPVTGGASIAVGVAAATASGALIKAGVKALDTIGTDRKYTLKDFGHDCATGAFSGALAPITGGLGGAVGKTVATKLGIQAVKQVGKEVAEEGVKEGVKGGVKQGLKTALTNPFGYEYVGGNTAKRTTALAAEMATDGALGGAIDGGFREGVEQVENGEELNWEEIAASTLEGGAGGLFMAPILGGGMKAVGKGSQKFFGKNNVYIFSYESVIKFIKNLDGSSRYTNTEIRKILKNMPANFDFTPKDLVNLLSLKGATANDVVDLFYKINTEDKFKLLNKLTSYKNFSDNSQTFNYLEIEDFFDNIEDCQISNLYDFFLKAINDYSYFGKNVITKESYLNMLSYHLKTEEQAQIYKNILSKIKRGKCKMLPNEIFAYLDLKIGSKEKNFDVSQNIMQLHSEIKKKLMNEEHETYLAFIDDEYVLKYLNNNMHKMNHLERESLLKSVTTAEGTLYVGESSFFTSPIRIQKFFEYAETNGIDISKIITNFDHPKINAFQSSALPIDIELAARFNHLYEYLGKAGDSDMKNYLYKNYYLKILEDFGISSDIISQLDKINNKYGVKIMISSNLKEIDDVLKYVDNELQAWQTASSGVAKMPPVIDFNAADKEWYDLASTQANTASSAYCFPFFNGSLFFNKQTVSSVQWSIRHEMTHTNDLKLGNGIDPKYLEVDLNGSLLKDKYGYVKPKRTKKLEKELLKAGIDRDLIDYAFINTKEFIAVASEGDISKYSSEFKSMLVEFGMPHWMLNIK